MADPTDEGDSDEADWILRRMHESFPAAPLYAVGVSLGGNLLAKWLGERAEDAAFVAAAASIGSPLDLAAGGLAISHGLDALGSRLGHQHEGTSLITKRLPQLRRQIFLILGREKVLTVYKQQKGRGGLADLGGIEKL